MNASERCNGGLRTVRRAPIAILGVPFDNVTKAEAIELIEQMISSRQPHYLVTPNVDFLVQARKDVELRRILFEAHLVLCDGTPLVWASRLLGNPLPERVAGADIVPLLTQIAAKRKYRLFLLGAAPQSAEQAVRKLNEALPDLIIAGYYSPPFNQLLDMDHEEIRRRIEEARPDILLVSFGCPKQEKWVAMHYRSLGIPVTAGVGATIDFLAGQVKRAPVWMQRSGTEWIFRLAQEPRRLFRRYFNDLWVFGCSILPQWWELRASGMRTAAAPVPVKFAISPQSECDWYGLDLPRRLDVLAVRDHPSLAVEIVSQSKDCVLNMRSADFIDSTGVGWLIHLQKSLRGSGHQLILLSPSPFVLRALKLMRLTDFFQIARSEEEARSLLREGSGQPGSFGNENDSSPTSSLRWRGEITAANADAVWESTRRYLAGMKPATTRTIDLSLVRFIDSTGLGLMIRAKKQCLAQEGGLQFIGLQPPVRNVVRLSRLEDFLLGASRSAQESLQVQTH